MDIKTIYEDNDLLVVDKPAGMPVFKEGNISEITLADHLIEKYPELKKNEPPRYGIIHRLDKDTSGILLVAKSPEALIFFQKQFSASARDLVGATADRKNKPLEKKIEKRYIALVVGKIKEKEGRIETLIGRSPKDKKKQKTFFSGEPGSFGKRQTITEYKVKEEFSTYGRPGENYTLLEVIPKTGRKHQIRCHLAYIHHPIAGDKLYGFKNQPTPKGLTRQFLHASYLKTNLPSGQEKEFTSPIPEDLDKIIKSLNKQ